METTTPQPQQSFIKPRATNTAGEEIAESFTACEKCGDNFGYPPIIMNGREVFKPRLCPIHSAEHDHELNRERQLEAEKQLEQKWSLICPPLYAQSDTARLNQKLVAAVAKWMPEESQGLGFIGSTGAGKTRCLFIALRRAFDAGKWCESISHNSFSKLSQDAFAGKETRAESLAKLAGLQRCAVLLLDDMGKPPPTERADAELEELIEIRTAHLRPILWSANGSSAWLEKRLGPDRGPALVRRLSEFSKVVTCAT